MIYAKRSTCFRAPLVTASQDFLTNADRGGHLKTCILAMKTTFLHVCNYSGLSTKRMTAIGVADC